MHSQFATKKMDRRTIKLCKIVGIVGLKEMKNSDNRCEDAL